MRYWRVIEMKGLKNPVAKFGLKQNKCVAHIDKKHRLQYHRQRKHKKPLEDD